jgi:hypothetical protein
MDLLPRLLPMASSSRSAKARIGTGRQDRTDWSPVDYFIQLVKAAGLAVAGLGLSTASGLNTWLIRKVPGAKHVTIGTERIRPWLLAAWAATYTLSLWDAWTGASKPEAERGSLIR